MADFKLRALQDGIWKPIEGSDSGLISSIKIGTTSSSEELTQAILEKLIAMQSVARADGKYDADQIVVAASPSNYSPATADVEAHLAAIDSALSTAGGTDFSDADFRISDNGDSSKKVAFEVSALTTATTRTVTMPDEDVDLGEVSDLRTLSGTSAGATDLGTFTGSTISDNVDIKQALQDLESAVEGASAGLTYRGLLAGASDLTGNATGNSYVDGGSGFEQGDFFKISSDGTLTTSTGTNIAVNTGDMIIINKDVANDGSVVDADLDKIDNTESADILRSGDLASAQIFVGNASNEAAAVDVTGDVTISNTGVTTIGAGVVENDMLEGNIATSKLVDSAELSEAVTFFGATDLSGAEAETLSDGSNADSLHEHSKLFESFTNNTGGQIDEGTIVALSKTVAGEIIVADASALSTAEAIVGVAAEDIADAASGKVQIYGKVAPTQDASFTIGQRVYLSESAGSTTSTAPSAAGTVTYVIGGAVSTTEIILNPHLEGVN